MKNPAQPQVIQAMTCGIFIFILRQGEHQSSAKIIVIMTI